MLKEYLNDISKTFKTGDATEPSYYPALKKLLDNYLKWKKQDPYITVEARKTKAGKPDFTIRNNKELIGHIEAKDLELKDLSSIHNDDQIKRYRDKLPNFILTNFIDFQLFRDGNVVKEARICQPAVLKRLKTAPPPQKEDEFYKFLDTFISYNIPELKSAKTLAKELAQRTQLLPSFIVEELTNDETDEIDRIYEAFKKYLIPDLTVEDFADIYAQTITYGLFTARLECKDKDFSRYKAIEYIPKNIHIFRDTFSLISGPALPESINWIVDDIATVLKYCNMKKIRQELHLIAAGGDPLMHFYETFLAEYDPKKRKARGVYYTPIPVVSYIIKSVNEILKKTFKKKEGFSNRSVTVLDPASGTSTFIVKTILSAKEEIDKGSIQGAWKQIIKNHILKNFYAFELLMAPYVIGHLKISLLLEDLGYKFDKTDRIPVYLTNTLELRDVKQAVDPYVAGLSEEAIEAKKIKEKVPIQVIIGNPPYSVSSANKSEFIEREMNVYKEDVRDERNIQPLSDDYIKFIRFAHWKIEKVGHGVIGMITNNSYLDGLIHRGMRNRLIQSFDEIYILNLHGNLKKKETTPEGEKDENIFDIQQGVAIALFIKSGETKKTKIYYQDLWGLREDKYECLNKNDVSTIKWQLLNVREPYYFFVPKQFNEEERYNKFLKLTDIFRNYNCGIVTGKDSFFIDFTSRELNIKFNLFRGQLPEKIIKETPFIKGLSDDLINDIRKNILQNNPDKKILDFCYRPFDIRKVFYDKKLIQRARYNLMKHMLKENIALVVTRQLSTFDFQHAFIAHSIVDKCCISLQTREASYVFPLNLYGDNQRHGEKDLFREIPTSSFNINADLLKLVNYTFKKEIDTKQIFYYIYAILYSAIYRQKYNEFLKIDFPRIPFTKDYRLFEEMVTLGKELVELHLLKSDRLTRLASKFPISNSGRVKKHKYKEKEKKLYINDKQFFSNISSEVWNYYIGGYQVLDKWLKERQERILNDDEIIYFLRVITALSYTIELQKEIDKLYHKIEKTL